MRGDRERLLDMIEICDLIDEHITEPAALEHPLVQAAAQRWIEVLGEAASNISEELRMAHPEIPWREMAGTRVILAHAYFHIDPAVIRSVISRDIGDLRAGLIAIDRDFGGG